METNEMKNTKAHVQQSMKSSPKKSREPELSVKENENSRDFSDVRRENLSQNFDQEESQDGSKFQAKSVTEHEGSEMNDKMEDDKSDDDRDELESVESLELKKRQFVFDRPKTWELQPVRIANVWDFMPDVVTYKWVKVRESEPISHKREKDRPKLYRCKHEECGKVFSDQPSLKKHMLTHGERMFLCPYEGCGKKFLDNSKLKRHYLVHTGEKKYKCDICGKLFSLDFNLRTHTRTHTGEKPYACRFPGCPKRFTQSSNLSAHEKIHMMKEQTGKTPTENVSEA